MSVTTMLRHKCLANGDAAAYASHYGEGSEKHLSSLLWRMEFHVYRTVVTRRNSRLPPILLRVTEHLLIWSLAAESEMLGQQGYNLLVHQLCMCRFHPAKDTRWCRPWTCDPSYNHSGQCQRLADSSGPEERPGTGRKVVVVVVVLGTYKCDDLVG
ncbi:hypothetical protein VTO42DRAFT_1083 [Malbranchea cinnamomea]